MDNQRELSSKNVLSTASSAPIAYNAEERKGRESGIEFPRTFSRPGVSPFDEVEWEIRTAAITSEKGEVLFEQKGVEIPKSWSQTAANIVVSKYFHGQIGTPDREWSVRQLVGRVVRAMTDWGIKRAYFASADEAAGLRDELAVLLLT